MPIWLERNHRFLFAMALIGVLVTIMAVFSDSSEPLPDSYTLKVAPISDKECEANQKFPQTLAEVKAKYGWHGNGVELEKVPCASGSTVVQGFLLESDKVITMQSGTELVESLKDCKTARERQTLDTANHVVVGLFGTEVSGRCLRVLYVGIINVGGDIGIQTGPNP